MIKEIENLTVSSVVTASENQVSIGKMFRIGRCVAHLPVRSVFCTTTSRLIHSSSVVGQFNLQLEQEIRSKIDSLPKLDNIFQNSDGTSRKPSDSELKVIAELNTLSEKRGLSVKDIFSLSPEEETLYKDNQNDLEEFKFSTKKIIDKIPFHDSKTGEIRWKVIRENEKEGWENVSYYLYVPALILLVGVLIYKNQYTVNDWAEDELMLRMRERAEVENDKELLDALDLMIPEAEVKLSRQEVNDRDSIIIERLLSGEYDNLAKLKIKQQEMYDQKE